MLLRNLSGDPIRNRSEGLVDVLAPRDEWEMINGIVTIELELQNEELQRSQQELLEFKTRYKELYDFTPVGYVCLDVKAVILNANLTLADMLLLERSSLIDQSLTSYVFFEDRYPC